jgi:hypothetical protein
MIGRLRQVVDALIAAADDQSTAIMPGIRTAVAKAPGPAPELATASLNTTPAGLFTGLEAPFPNPLQLKLSGRVQIGANVPNPPAPASLRVGVDFPSSQNQALTSSAGQSTAVAADGTWEVSPTLRFHDQVPRYTLHGSVTVEAPGAPGAPVRAQPLRIDNAGLAWCLDILDREETRLKLANRLMFLARVRKVTQVVGAFDFVVGQTRDEPKLFAGDPDMAARWKAANVVRVDGQPIRLDHIGAAIEGGRRQQPRLALPNWLAGFQPLVDPVIGDLLSWGGDLGSAVGSYLFQRHFPEVYGGSPVYPTVTDYVVELASHDQLRADLDGVVMADRYDRTRPFAAQLRDWFDHDSGRRFSLFIATERTRTGELALRLKPGDPPRLTEDSKAFLAGVVSNCAQLLLAGTLFLKGWRPPAAPDAGTATGVAYPAPVDAALDKGSPEVQLAVTWFVDFLQKGLDAE